MTSLLILSGDIRQKLTFNENKGIFARIFTKQWIQIYFSPNRMLSTLMFLSRMETRASSLFNFFISADCHKQRMISVYEDTNVH